MTYSMMVGKYKLIFSDTHFKDFRKKPTISVYDADTNSETKIASFNSQETFEWFVEAVADRKTENSSEIPNNCEEPQYEMGMGTLKCDNCSEYGSFKCTKCDGEMYFKRLEPKDEPQKECKNCREGQEHDCYGCPFVKQVEPQTERGDFADRLAYERGIKHAWEVAQKVFDSTVTFYEAEDVAKQIDKDINVRSKGEPQTDCAWK